MDYPSPYRILSTRALGNNARDFIHHRDWLVDIVSLIETHGAINGEQIAEFLKAFGTRQNNFLLLFSSENAVKWLKWGFDKFGFHMPPGIKTVTVGEKALLKAVECFEAEPVFTEKNSQLLLSRLKETFTQNTSFLFFCGNHRLDTLPLGLRDAGFVVEEYIVYRTELTPHKTVRDYACILFFSPSAVQSYFTVNNWNTGMVAVSIGPTTTHSLKQAGVGHILEGREPNEMAMLERLQEYLSN